MMIVFWTFPCIKSLFDLKLKCVIHHTVGGEEGYILCQKVLGITVKLGYNE